MAIALFPILLLTWWSLYDIPEHLKAIAAALRDIADRMPR